MHFIRVKRRAMEQQPLTLAEIKKHPAFPCWVERRAGGEVEPDVLLRLPDKITFVSRVSGVVHSMPTRYYPIDYYGITWRCWRERPDWKVCYETPWER